MYNSHRFNIKIGIRYKKIIVWTVKHKIYFFIKKIKKTSVTQKLFDFCWALVHFKEKELLRGVDEIQYPGL